MSKLDYNEGDPIYIFSEAAPGIMSPGSAVKGVVTRVTRTHQITVLVNDVLRRFNSHGGEIGNGGTAWHRGPWIESKAEANTRIRRIVQYNSAVRLRRHVRESLEAMLKIDPLTNGSKLMLELARLTEVVRGIK